MRCITLIFLICSLSILVEKNGFSQEKTSISRVVIDAGHGGKDPGTIGKRSQEKNIALQIALKLSKEILSQCKGVTVICTRTTDEFIELHERAEIANRSKADLFISIHCNANPKHSFQGAETYVMGLHRTEANLEIAKKENAAILMEPNYSTNYNGFDPNSDESYITRMHFWNRVPGLPHWYRMK
jgi:N-acetylmuramoyl-L-alanine amidase